MAKATGLGGAFLRAKDPKALYAWYEQHLGLKHTKAGFILPVKEPAAYTILSFFRKDESYWPVEQPVMLNFQVDDLDALLNSLEEAGVAVDANRQDTDYGRFGWFTDPEGNRVELWQPESA